MNVLPVLKLLPPCPFFCAVHLVQLSTKGFKEYQTFLFWNLIEKNVFEGPPIGAIDMFAENVPRIRMMI